MTTISTIYSGHLRTTATHVKSGEKLNTDAPPDNQGRGEYFSPTDLLTASLGSCMLTIMGISAREHGFDIDGARAEITKVMGSNPRRVSEIIIDLYFSSNQYSAKHKKMIEVASKTCPVALSLHPDLKQTVRIHYA